MATPEHRGPSAGDQPLFPSANHDHFDHHDPSGSTIASPTATPTATAIATPIILAGDADCDGLLTEADIAATLAALFEAPDPLGCSADCNGDGVVNGADVLCAVRALSEAG